MKKLTFIITALLAVVLQAPAGTRTDDIITTLPATAKDSLYLQDTFYGYGKRMQHYTWSGHFYYIALDENKKDVYFKDLCSAYVFGTYVKGEIEGNTVRIPTGQHVFHDDPNPDNKYTEADLYLYAGKIQGDSIALDKDAPYIDFTISVQGTLTSDKAVVYADPTGYLVARNYTYKFVPFNIEAATTVVPEGADIKKYNLEYLPEPGKDKIATTAEVAFSDDDVYVKGLTQTVPGWIKGTVDGDSVRFSSHQYVGRYNNSDNLLTDYAVFFNGAVATDSIGFFGRVYATTAGIAFKYDKTAGTLIASQSVSETIGEQNRLSHMVAPALTPAENGGAYAPAKPAVPEIEKVKNYGFSSRMTVKLPTYDTGGNPLNTDSLAYRFFMDGQPFTFTTDKYNYIEKDMTEIPYSYLDYNGLGSDISKSYDDDSERIIVLYDDYDEIGVECVYTINGVTNVSDRYVYDVKSKTGGVVSGIISGQIAKRIASVTYKDLNGRSVSHPESGLYIKTVTYDDHTRVNSKVLK